MGTGHYPDLDEIRRAADKIENKHKDLRSATAMRKLVNECEQYRNGVPVVAPGQTEKSEEMLVKTEGLEPIREG